MSGSITDGRLSRFLVAAAVNPGEGGVTLVRREETWVEPEMGAEIVLGEARTLVIPIETNTEDAIALVQAWLESFSQVDAVASWYDHDHLLLRFAIGSVADLEEMEEPFIDDDFPLSMEYDGLYGAPDYLVEESAQREAEYEQEYLG